MYYSLIKLIGRYKLQGGNTIRRFKQSKLSLTCILTASQMEIFELVAAMGRGAIG